MPGPTQTPAQPPGPTDYSKPERLCDVVMKGGITSGVVYPSAVCELARVYSFKNIGGASAGAIAAAATAAAEYARRKGNVGAQGRVGFARLEELSNELATSLSTLFQANRDTKPLFAVLNSWLDLGDRLSTTDKVMAVARSLNVNFPNGAALGMLLGLFLLLILCSAALWVWLESADRSAQWWIGFIVLFGPGILFATLLTLLFRVVGAAIGLARRCLSVLPNNNFGLCSGMNDLSGRHKPLTEWLTDELERIAGKNDPNQPLTFGDLKSAVSPLEVGLAPEERGINLEMMTTNLTLGRPYRLPSLGGSREFFFDPIEFRKLFPSRIVNWMVERSAKLKPRSKSQADEWESFRPLLPLPVLEDLPVIVATRMSLSFPVLLSAVPLHMVDRSVSQRRGAQAEQGREEAAQRGAAKAGGEDAVNGSRLERCWFSDGGICSNFPIHFFDRPIPRWPTFGINLRPVHRAYHYEGQPESEKVYLVKSNSAGLVPLWDRFDEKESGLGRMSGFLAAIVNTMYNWADNLQTSVPGYRDRVVHIYHTKKEGGMNLNMKREVIAALSARGACAGKKLRSRFTGQDIDSNLSWTSHRWTRYRTTMSLLEKLLSDLRRAYNYDCPGEAPYAELIQPQHGELPAGYAMDDDQRAFARAATEQIIAALDDWESQGQTFTDKRVPRPEPELRVRPKV